MDTQEISRPQVQDNRSPLAHSEELFEQQRNQSASELQSHYFQLKDQADFMEAFRHAGLFRSSLQQRCFTHEFSDDSNQRVVMLGFDAHQDIPAHDHPGQHIANLVLHGTVNIKHYYKCGRRKDAKPRAVYLAQEKILQCGDMDFVNDDMELHALSAVTNIVVLLTLQTAVLAEHDSRKKQIFQIDHESLLGVSNTDKHQGSHQFSPDFRKHNPSHLSVGLPGCLIATLMVFSCVGVNAAEPLRERLNPEAAALNEDHRKSLAICKRFHSGNHKNLDEQTAFEHCHTAAAAGISEAQFEVGAMYMEGIGIEQNSEHALNWVSQSASQGHRQAQRLFEALLDSDFTFGC